MWGPGNQEDCAKEGGGVNGANADGVTEAEREGSGEKTQKPLEGERPLVKGAEKGDNAGRAGGAHAKGLLA